MRDAVATAVFAYVSGIGTGFFLTVMAIRLEIKRAGGWDRWKDAGK